MDVALEKYIINKTNRLHKEPIEFFILTIHVVYSYYNFIPELLRQLDMELKLYHIWHLKFGARFPKLLE